ncbi:uncharacterized protein LOC129875801 [Solanum dulcamara]|uniref:uncharacterized protein LOC129875801 n=1 Tax=Solanum dulcamara TaxID=45834 RepID=UPI0024868A7B|nr:uncharacterized protein LOC129875801 [Solanum dulcamara]
MVTDEHNRNLKAIPTMEELRTVVFLMNPNSAAGPDGMNGAEVLSRLRNNLHQHPQYHGFLMAKKGPQINHLSFADDIIIFSSGRSHTLKLIMETLHTYEHASGQLINRDKSNFMVPSNAFNSTVRRIKKVTGFKQRIIYYSELIAKVVARIAGWQAKLISYGGRVTLIKHVIQALPIHLLSASSPPATTIKQIQSITTNFFWGWKNERRKYHWSSWKNLSYPYEEGGIGVRLISDVAKSFQYKQWWIFRTKNSLWTEFLKAKYCQRSNPITKKWHTGQSLIWKHLMKNKHNVEPHIQWQIQSGSCLFWWDNWLGVGPLANFRKHLLSLYLASWQVTSTISPTNLIRPLGSLITVGYLVVLLPRNLSGTKGVRQELTLKHGTNTFLLSVPFYSGEHLEGNCLLMKSLSALEKPQPNVTVAIELVWIPLTIYLFLETLPGSWPNSWKELVLLVEKYTNEVNVSTVYWRKPSAHMVKLNTDGSALHNPGKIGGGGLLSNNQGDLLFAFSTPFGEGTNNQSKILAAIFGLTWCLQLGYTKVILEVDSELVIRWIKHLAQQPWTVKAQLQQLQDINHQFQVFKSSHTYREANFTADALSKHSHKCTTPQIYLTKQELPKEARAYFELDKLEMANFKRRRLKRIKKPP